jgi:hypothetical protein
MKQLNNWTNGLYPVILIIGAMMFCVMFAGISTSDSCRPERQFVVKIFYINGTSEVISLRARYVELGGNRINYGPSTLLSNEGIVANGVRRIEFLNK